MTTRKSTHLQGSATLTVVSCIVAVAVSCSSGTDESTSSSGNGPPQKSDFTQVTTEMFVDRSALPNSSAMAFGAPTISKDPQGTTDPVDPPECGPIFWGPPFSQRGSVSWSTLTTDDTSPKKEGKDVRLFLALAAARPDLKALVGKCGTVRYQGTTETIAPLPLPGLPSWADATRISVAGATGVGVLGLYRGLYISLTFTQLPAGDISPDDTHAVVQLFNAEVTKLETM